MLTQLPRVPSLIPSSFATLAIGREVSITIFTASSLNSGEKLFFGRGNYFTFPDVHPIGRTVRKLRGTPVQAKGLGWSFHESMNAPIAAVSSLTEVKEQRWMAWRVMTEKKHSRLSHEQLVGVKFR